MLIMATEKVGIYRKYHGPVPRDSSGQPLPRNEWSRKRAFRWAVRWFGKNGNRYSKSFESRKEAERFAETKQAEVREGRSDPCPEISLKDFMREHADLMKGNLAASTLHLHTVTMELLAASVGKHRMLHTITTKDIERFRANRLKKGLSPSSANKEVRALSRVFNLAILRGYLRPGGNPCFGIPMLRVASKRPVYVSPQEFQEIYRRAPDSLWRALLVTIYATGIRYREAINLLWRDVDFEACQLHVTRRTAEGLVQAWTPKDHEMRSIPLPPQAISLLATWQSVAPEGCPYVFMEQGRWDYYRREALSHRWRAGQDLVNNVLRRFKTLCRHAGVGPYTLHDLRRSCITNWAKQLPIHVVQQLAGHSDIQTTKQFYLSVQSEDVAKAQKIQAALLARIPQADLTDPLLTHSASKRAFSGRKVWKGVSQDEAG
jgi:integrase